MRYFAPFRRRPRPGQQTAIPTLGPNPFPNPETRMSQGTLFIVSAPSGAGKTSLVRELI